MKRIPQALRPRTSLAALAFAASALAGPATAAGSPKACIGLSVDGERETSRQGAVSRFSASKVLDVSLEAHLHPLIDGDHLVTFRLFAPSGNLYQALDVPTASPGKTEEKERSVRGYPHPVKVVRPVPGANKNGNASNRIDVPFPVGGTAIVTRGLYGTWRLEAVLDGDPKDACPAEVFEIVP